jgi:hypothetical protein
MAAGAAQPGMPILEGKSGLRVVEPGQMVRPIMARLAGWSGWIPGFSRPAVLLQVPEHEPRAVLAVALNAPTGLEGEPHLLGMASSAIDRHSHRGSRVRIVQQVAAQAEVCPGVIEASQGRAGEVKISAAVLWVTGGAALLRLNPGVGSLAHNDLACDAGVTLRA